MAATFVSSVLCLIYLAFLPFHVWALAVLVGASALTVMLLGRLCDAVTAGITTTVVMVVAAWAGIQVKRLLTARSVVPAPPKAAIDLSERAMVRGQPRGRSCGVLNTDLEQGLCNPGLSSTRSRGDKPPRVGLNRSDGTLDRL